MDKQAGRLNASLVIEEFLLDVWDGIPSSTDSVANALQRFRSEFESLVYRLKEQHEQEGQAIAQVTSELNEKHDREGRTINRMVDKLSYLKTIEITAGDTATRATVIKPLVHHLREFLKGIEDDDPPENA